MRVPQIWLSTKPRNPSHFLLIHHFFFFSIKFCFVLFQGLFWDWISVESPGQLRVPGLTGPARNGAEFIWLHHEAQLQQHPLTQSSLPITSTSADIQDHQPQTSERQASLQSYKKKHVLQLTQFTLKSCLWLLSRMYRSWERGIC